MNNIKYTGITYSVSGEIGGWTMPTERETKEEKELQGWDLSERIQILKRGN